MLSSNHSKCNNEREEKEEYKIVHVKYLDHTIANNLPKGTVKISEREIVGWLIHQDTSEITIRYDKSCRPQPFEKVDLVSELCLYRCGVISISELVELDRLTFDGKEYCECKRRK